VTEQIDFFQGKYANENPKQVWTLLCGTYGRKNVTNLFFLKAIVKTLCAFNRELKDYESKWYFEIR